MKYSPNLLDPCSDCGGEIPMNTLTEKNIAWAMEHGVRCEGCDAKKRARQVDHPEEAKVRAVEAGENSWGR
jgi:hypothetical protein